MAEERLLFTAVSSCVAATLNLLMSNDDSEPRNNATDDCTTLMLTAACSSLCRDERVKIRHYVDRIIPGYLPDQFKRFFRVSPETFDVLLHHLSALPEFQDEKPAGGRPPVPLEKKLLMVLWYLATQDSISSVSDRFDVQKSTCLYHNRLMIDVFCTHLCKKFVAWPTDEQKDMTIAAFETKKGFPGVLGAIDGTHIEIKALGDKESDYVNRKGYHSVILQAICNHDRVFTDIYCGWPGRVNDARVYRNSPFFENKERLCGRNHIIGDSAYPLSSFLMKPYRDTGNLTHAEKQFNKSQCGTRSVIENAFGILKGRFRRLQFINMTDINYITKTISMCCILHNICVLNNDQLDEIFHHVDEPVATDGNLPAQDVLGTLKRQLITRQIAAANR